jgi:hypothetical protein
MDAQTDPCLQPLPPQAEAALALFNAGEYYRQHDLFEALWREETRPVRQLYQGILQVGVAYHQIEMGNRRGAIKMLNRSERWLNALPEVCQSVDVAALRADAARVRLALLALTDDMIDQFDRSLLRPVQRR